CPHARGIPRREGDPEGDGAASRSAAPGSARTRGDIRRTRRKAMTRAGRAGVVSLERHRVSDVAREGPCPQARTIPCRSDRNEDTMIPISPSKLNVILSPLVLLMGTTPVLAESTSPKSGEIGLEQPWRLGIEGGA